MGNNLYRIKFSAIKVAKASAAFIEYVDHTNAVTIYEKTVPEMKKKFWFFDDRMETFTEAFDRTWTKESWDLYSGFPSHSYGKHIAKELYDQAKVLSPTELMDLDDRASKIVTWFNE